MGYQKFKANVWAKNIETELERSLVFVKDCNRAYEGVVKKLGDSVTIKGAGKVTMHTGSDGQSPNFSSTVAPEDVEGTNTIMSIKHYTAFNFKVDDIDAAQGADGAIAIYTRQASHNTANEMDTLVASLAADPLAVYDNASAVKITANNVLETIDAGLQKLWENDVKPNDYVSLTVSPRFYMILKQKYQALDTDNSEMLKRGAVAMYGNVDIKLSNNVYTTNSGAQDKIMLRTKNAIAFANPLTKVEPYRPDAYMSDAVRGISLYDAKLIRPEQMIVLNCKYTD